MSIRLKEILIVSIIVMFVGLFYFLTIRNGHDWGGDFSMYIHHAKNLVEGVNYKETGFISNPNAFISPDAYPPVFPLFLTPIYYWFGLNLDIMKMEVITFFLLSLFAIFFITRGVLPFWLSICSIIIIGFSPYFWEFKDNVLSDNLFLFFSCLSILLLQFKHQSSNLFKSHFFIALLFAFLCYLAYGTRSIGLVFLPCILLFDVIKLKKISNFTIITSTLFTTFILLQTILFRSETKYLEHLTFNPQTLLMNSINYLKSLSIIMDNGYSNYLRYFLFVIVTLFALFGFATRLKEDFRLFDLFVVIYLLVIIYFPKGYTRYLIPIIPFYFLYFFVGIEKFPLLKEKKKYIYLILISGLLLSHIAKYSTLDFKSVSPGIENMKTQEFFNFVKTNTDEKDVFIFFKPRVFSLFTGRAASIYHKPDDQNELWHYFKKIDAKYLVKGPYDTTYLVSFINNFKNKLKIEFSNVDFEVYELIYK